MNYYLLGILIRENMENQKLKIEPTEIQENKLWIKKFDFHPRKNIWNFDDKLSLNLQYQ